MRIWKTGVGAVASIAAVLLLGSAFLPTLCRSRETANRVKCAGNLRQIGRAIEIYAREHAGQSPPDFATLLKTTDLVPEVFTCPSGLAERAESVEAFVAGPTDKNCSYTYVGDGLTLASAPAEIVLAFEALDNHDRDGISVLFADDHVEFLQVSRRTPQAWYGRLIEASKSTTRPVVIEGNR